MPKTAEPISDGTMFNRMMDGAMAMLGGKVQTKYSYGAPAMSREQGPAGRWLRVGRSLGLPWARVCLPLASRRIRPK